MSAIGLAMTREMKDLGDICTDICGLTYAGQETKFRWRRRLGERPRPPKPHKDPDRSGKRHVYQSKSIKSSEEEESSDEDQKEEKKDTKPSLYVLRSEHYVQLPLAQCRPYFDLHFFINFEFRGPRCNRRRLNTRRFIVTISVDRERLRL